MSLSEQKPDIFTYKLTFNSLPQLITTLNNYASSLPALANVNWPAFPESNLVNLWLVKWCQWGPPVCQWELDMAYTVSARLSRPSTGILVLCGCM